DLELARDDVRTPGRWLYRAAIVGRDANVRGRVDAQGFVDSDPAVDAATPPSYADGATPRRTTVRLRLEPLEPGTLGLAPLRVTSAALDVGAFEDVANPANRRAASLGIVDGGRARVAHALTLDALTLWRGARLQADNTFDGRYYDSGERAITWRTRIGLDQAFGDAAQLALAFTRDVEEGETPFRFDAASPRARTEATASFSARLAPWASFAANGGYVFVEARRPESVGWSPVTSHLTLFQSSPWIDASLEHRWLLGEDDLGTATARVALQGRADLAQLRASVTHVIDLQPTEGPPRTDRGSTAIAWSVGVDRVAALSLDATYLALDADAAPGWGTARAGASIGSLRAGDARPGLQVDAVLDLDLLRVTDTTVTARADVGPVAVRLLERIAFGDGSDPDLAPVVADARVEATWTGVAALEARGFVWLPPAWLGHGDPAPAPRPLSVRLADAPTRQAPRWDATWRTTVDPRLAPDGGRRDTRFEVRLGLVQERLGPVFLSVDALAEWSLADDVQPEAFLRRAALTIGADAWERVGLQGRLGYQGVYDPVAEDLARSTLSIEDLTLTVRATDELFLGARVRDVWELTGTDAARSPWTVRPEVFFVWDRCCWALIGAWDASTGQVRIALTGPGGGDGVSETFDTPWTLPRATLPEAP
ncbi:MAG: hypothetical protein P1P87_09075, partial [Trueperaceae bacterium]|nr:hypothetical protein [Trueperaceae bacterium]